jgi:hypothetical protein
MLLSLTVLEKGKSSALGEVHIFLEAASLVLTSTLISMDAS